MPGGQVEVLHSQDNGYFYIPLASIITAVMFAPKVVATKFSILFFLIAGQMMQDLI